MRYPKISFVSAVSAVLACCDSFPLEPAGHALATAWCEVDGTDRIEIYLQPSAFSDAAALQEGDLTYPLEYCSSSPRCISDPVILDLNSTNYAPGDDWCVGRTCFEMTSLEGGDAGNRGLRLVRGHNQRYDTREEFALDETGVIVRFSYASRTYTPCA